MQYIQHIRNTHSINRDSRLSSNHVNDELISRDVSSLDICLPIRIVFLFNDNIDEWREMAEFDGLIGRNLSAERNVDYPEVNLENRWIKDRPEDWIKFENGEFDEFMWKCLIFCMIFSFRSM